MAQPITSAPPGSPRIPLNLETLPDELLLHLLSFLPPKELLASTCRLSRKFQRLALDPVAWQGRYRAFFPAAHPNPPPTPPLKTIQEEVLDEAKVRERITRQTTAMAAEMAPYTPFGKCSTPLHLLSEWAKKYPDSQTLQIVHTDQDQLSRVTLTDYTSKWPRLREFRLSAPPETLKGIRADQLVAFFKGHPHLTSVKLEGLSSRIDEKALIAALSFCKHLKELDVDHDFLSDAFLAFLSKNFNLRVLKITGKQNFTGEGLTILTEGFVDLIHCELHVGNMVWSEDDWIPFLEKHPKINVLTLHPDKAHIANDRMLRKIAALLRDLRKLQLYGCREVTADGLQALQGCPRLQTLFLDGCSPVALKAVSQQEPFTTFLSRLNYCSINPLKT